MYRSYTRLYAPIRGVKIRWRVGGEQKKYNLKSVWNSGESQRRSTLIQTKFFFFSKKKFVGPGVVCQRCKPKIVFSKKNLKRRISKKNKKSEQSFWLFSGTKVRGRERDGGGAGGREQIF